MQEFSLLINDNEFYDTKDSLDERTEDSTILELSQDLEDLYNNVSEKYQDLLTVLVHEDNDYINLNEFKDFISTHYGYSNFESMWNLFEEFKKFHQNEKPWENVSF